MKRFLSVISIVLIAVTLASCFTSCKKDDENKEDILAFDVSGYNVVYPGNASREIIEVAQILRERINSKTELELGITEDLTEAAEKEIIVGNTNRPESATLKAKLDGAPGDNWFAIEVMGSKIVILGKSNDVTLRAVRYFATEFVSTSQKKGTIAIASDYSKAHEADMSTLFFAEHLVELKIGTPKNIFLSERDVDFGSTVTYPKLVELQYQANEADNGIMLATFNSSETYYRIMRSDDKGDTWTEVTQVYDNYNKDLRGGRMPMLYELPVDMGDYKKGTIFLAGTSSPIGGEKANYEKTAITLCSSTDLGETWTDLPSIDYAKGKIDGDGIWEPFLIYEEETQRLYCFYSDDSDPKHDQKLVYKYTTDLKTWVGKDGKTGQTDDPYEAVACNDPTLRPGMISISKMGNGEYIMTYEMVGFSMNPTYAKKTTRLDDWGDISDYGTEVLSTERNSFGSSPWNAWSPVGGECGTLVVAGKHRVQDKTNKNAPSLFFSFDYGKTYLEVENPIGYVVNGNNRSGYSPCVMFSADGKTLYYATNPDKVSDPNKAYVAMVRIDILG